MNLFENLNIVAMQEGKNIVSEQLIVLKKIEFTQVFLITNLLRLKKFLLLRMKAII